MRIVPWLLPLLLTACAATRPSVQTGIDRLQEEGFALLQGKRVGLITNHTGLDSQGRGTAEILAAAKGVRLMTLFSPEHGFSGTSEKLSVGSTHVTIGGRDIAVRSLYRGGLAGMRPRAEDLKDLDVLVFDIQDIGARFYTYFTTMGMALEEAAKAGVTFMVLDRPNPIDGVTMEGPLLKDLSLRLETATAYFPVPIRHGLTAGEMALLHNETVKHADLIVVKMTGWYRRLWYDQTNLPWKAPSPNMPDLDAAALYPGIGCFEASNLSVGRGTPVPFRWIGAPWMDAAAVVKRLTESGLEGIRFTEETFTPTKSVFKGRLSHGVRMTITDRSRLRSLDVFAHITAALRDLNPEFHFRWKEAKRMVGTEEFRSIYERKGTPQDFIDHFDSGPRDFKEIRKPFLIYR